MKRCQTLKPQASDAQMGCAERRIANRAARPQARLGRIPSHARPAQGFLEINLRAGTNAGRGGNSDQKLLQPNVGKASDLQTFSQAACQELSTLQIATPIQQSLTRGSIGKRTNSSRIVFTFSLVLRTDFGRPGYTETSQREY